MTREKVLENFTPYLELNFKSEATIRTYLSMAKKFIYDNQNIDRMTKNDIEKYLIDYKKNHAIRTYNVMASVIKMVFSGIFGQPYKTSHLKFIKPPNPIIEVLSVSEVSKMISRINNLKHKAIIATLYYTGCRVSEFLALRIKDISNEIIDGKKIYKISVTQGKGSYGRHVPIPEELVILLRQYYKKYKPKEYLFEGSVGLKYSKSSVTKILKKNYNGRKKIYPHLMRHTIATHHVDNGIQITKLQNLLGHKSLKSTMLYVHLSSKSLMDISFNNVLKSAA
jgi:site-specific recombinase XerD